MKLTFHFMNELSPDDYQHKKHLIENYLRSKGVPTERPGDSTSAIHHAWIEID